MKSNWVFLLVAGLLVSSCVAPNAGKGTVGGLQSGAGSGSGAESNSGTPTAGSATGGVPTPTPSSPSGSGTAHLPPGQILDSAGFPSCLSADADHYCLALKVVAFQDDQGVPVLTEAQAVSLVTGINHVWSQCNLGFQLEDYQSVDPDFYDLSYDSDWQNDGDQIRSVFQDANKFVVIGVGSLTGSTIAVTEMPGASVFGTLVEKSFVTNPLTVGHELGHYQGLYHVNDTTNLLNPYIGSNTSSLTASQCAIARSTDLSDWTAMRRQ